jgi:hypothetical protein
MNSTLTIIIDTSQVDVQVMLNNDSVAVIDGKCVLGLDLSRVNKIYLNQMDTTQEEKFFTVKSIYFGALDVTQLMHHDTVCEIYNLHTNTKIGRLGRVGGPDQMRITIGPDFYDLMIKNVKDISLQQ